MQSATPYLDPDTAAPTAIPRAIGTIRGSGWERAQDEYLTTTARVKGVAAAYDLAQCLTSPVQTMLAQQERLRATVMQSSGRSATMAGAADIYGTAGLVAKGGGVCGPFGFANSLYAYPGVASAVKDTLAEHRRMQDRMMKSLGPSATVAGGADIYGKLGPVAKTGWMPDTAAVTKSWQSRAGVASAVKDTLAEHRRMQDRMMKSLGPSATVAGTADIYGTAGLVAKGSVVSEPFGFAKSLDAHRGAAYMSPEQNQVGEMLRTLDSLTASARAAVAHGTLGLVTGVSGYSPGFNGVRTIADFASSLIDAGGRARINDEIERVERSFVIPSAVTDMARTLAGSAQLAGIIEGVDPFTGLAVPMGIGDYLRAPGVVDTLSEAWPALDLSDDITADKRVIVPDPLKDSLLWLPTIGERRFGLAATFALTKIIGYMYLETGVTPPGHVIDLVYVLLAVLTVCSEAVERKSSDG
jgi:hypothetical protein